MVAHHRKKIVTRTLDTLVKNGVKTEGSRIGKNYFLKYLLENPDMRRELNERSNPWQGTLSAPSAIQTSEKPSKDQNEPPFTQPSTLEETYVEMIVVLLSRVFSILQTTPQVSKSIDSYLLSDMIALYKEFFSKDYLLIKTYEQAAEVTNKIKNHSGLAGSLKYFDQIHLQRLLNMLVELNKRDAEEEQKKKKKKNQTQTRVSRLIFIWKLVKEKKSVSMIDISNLISTDLEKDAPFKIDKKTIMRLIDDLESLGVIAKKVFRIKIESQKILHDVTQFNRVMVADSFLQINDEQLRQDPCIRNPTFKRTNLLPTSLDFLANGSQSSKLLKDQRPKLLSEIQDKALKQSEKHLIPPQMKTKAEALISVLRSTDLRLKRQSLVKLRCNSTLLNVSTICQQEMPSTSVTDHFFQNKFEMTFEVNYISDMLLSPQDDLQKAFKKPSMLDFEAKTMTKPQKKNTLDKYFESEDQHYAKWEQKERSECQSSQANVLKRSMLEEDAHSQGNGTDKLPSLHKLESSDSHSPSLHQYRAIPRRQERVLDYEAMKEISTLKQPEVIYQRIVHHLKKGHLTTRDDLVSKTKHNSVANIMLGLMLLQGTIEEVSFIDERGTMVSYLRSS